MGPEGNEPGDGHDDLFEGLDTFFSSMGEDDWPDSIDTSSDRPTGDRTPSSKPTSSEEGGVDRGEPATTPPAEEPEARPGHGIGGAEMTSADWSRLRGVLGEEGDEGEEVLPEGGSETGAEEALFGYAAADEEGEGGPAGEPPDAERELTVEDLKKPPPQYRDLPPPPDEEPAAEGPLFPETS